MKLSLGLRLNIGLITTTDIQAWADESILKGNYDQFTLDISFLRNETEIRNYFSEFKKIDLFTDRLNISIKILKEYISQKRTLDMYQYIANIELINSYICAPELMALIATYTSKMEAADLGYIDSSVKQEFEEFLQCLNAWLKLNDLT